MVMLILHLRIQVQKHMQCEPDAHSSRKKNNNYMPLGYMVHSNMPEASFVTESCIKSRSVLKMLPVVVAVEVVTSVVSVVVASGVVVVAVVYSVVVGTGVVDLTVVVDVVVSETSG